MIDVALLQALVDTGATAQAIVDAVKASQDGTNERKAAVREMERIRKREYRSKVKEAKKVSNADYVPDVPWDVPDIGKKINEINESVPTALARADSITSSSSITQQEESAVSELPLGISNGTRSVVLTDPEVDLFRRGKEVLGRTSGGMIVKLKDHFKGSIPKTRAAIETASEKQNAREYISRIIVGKQPERPQNWAGIEGVT